jgi:hypothetical protein
MEYQKTGREARLDNQKRKRLTLTKGGAKRIHLLAEIERKRYREAEARPR